MSDNNKKASVDENKIKIPRPNNILMDIYGVVTSWQFVEELRNYLKNNIKEFLNRKLSDKLVVKIIDKLREQAAIEKSAGIQIPLIEEPNKSNEEIINSVVANVLWQIENKHKTSQIQLDTLYNTIWSDAYKTSRLKVHTFADVKKAIEHWRFHQFIKIYSYASGVREGQKLFLSSTVSGDLSSFFANYINSSGGYKYDPNKFRVVLSALRESDPKNLLYLTDDPKKARAALEVGLRAVVVIRPGNHRYTKEELNGLITIESFDQIQFEEEPGKPAPCC